MGFFNLKIMARPVKHNADYFSHDTEMRNDIKIKALRRKFSHLGYSVWNMLLELLTTNEYFEYEWNEMGIELLAPDFDCDADDIKSIVDYCIKLNLLQITNGYLHCEKLTIRLEETVLLRRKGYCNDNSKRYKSKIVNVNNNEVNVNINGQSKVKESKVNESKVNESKVNESKVKETKLNKTELASNTASEYFTNKTSNKEFDRVFGDMFKDESLPIMEYNEVEDTAEDLFS
jgi:hypothetical protein